jgi:site-specific DNA-methyltransferase (adenine-specific)
MGLEISDFCGLVHNSDCIELLGSMPKNSVDLVFADPPFNIGYRYDKYDDRKTKKDYLEFSLKWMSLVYEITKNEGSFWLAIGDEYAAELKLIATDSVGFRLKSWVIWYYTFGVNCKNNFSRSHTHIIYFTKDAGKETFNAESIKVASARQAVYGDKRAKSGGRIPDNTWILRPQDGVDTFQSTHDVWHVPRVCGTYKERVGWHPCQMPIEVLDRIIKVSSNPGDVVIDPFAGSGTSLVSAKKLGRNFIGIETSSEYCKGIRERLSKVEHDVTG